MSHTFVSGRTGCLQVGDRILAVDEREVDAEQLALLLDNPGPPLILRVWSSLDPGLDTLPVIAGGKTHFLSLFFPKMAFPYSSYLVLLTGVQVSFSVAESVVPASGVFTVKLAKCRPGLGITITGE